MSKLTPRSSGASTSRPNILIISVDQMRFRNLNTFPDNPLRPSIDSLLPNLTKLKSTGSPSITNPMDPGYNPGSGVSFTNYVGAATACTPARAAWVTGLYAPQTRMYDTESTSGQPALDPGFPTWGSILTDATGLYGFQSFGYRTAWIGKWHLSAGYQSPSGLTPYGFSFVWPSISPNGEPNEGASGGIPECGAGSEGLKSDAQIAQKFVTWFNKSGADLPWCTTVSFINPHDIAFAPLAFGPVLDPANGSQDQQAAEREFGLCFPTASTFPAGGFIGSVFDGYFSQGPLAAGIPNWENLAPLVSQGIKPSLQEATMQGRSLTQELYNSDGTRQPLSEQVFVRNLDLYLWLWAMVDAQIGVVLNTLWGNPDVAANTIILFCSDHGEFGGSHGMIDKTGALYDESIRVPLDIWFPYALQIGGPALQYQGTRSFPCSTVDFCPLILALASGSEAWRQTPSLAHLQTRQSICAMLAGNNGPNVRTYTLSTTDELLVDEGTPETVGGQHHLIAYRDSGGKLVQSSYWQPCTDAIDLTRAQFFEFYDYALGNTGEIGNDVFNSPNVPAYLQDFQAALATEFVLPPPNLSAPYARALTNYLAYASQTTRKGGCTT